MDINLESYVMEYHRRARLEEIEQKYQIDQALGLHARPKRRFLAQVGNFMRALGNARKIRIEISFEYNDPVADSAGC